jgi:hypothetical protein
VIKIKTNENPSSLTVSLEREWQSLSDIKLPIKKADSVWRFSRRIRSSDPEQGWKLHISATVLTANDVLRAVSRRLDRLGVLFKAPSTLRDLERINRGIYYGYSQIGKFITVYPRNEAEAVSLANTLHLSLKDFLAPVVPFDEQFKPRSCIFYRYGGFRSLEIQRHNGQLRSAIRLPNGKLTLDRREAGAAVPKWLPNPFPPLPSRNGNIQNHPLKTTIHVYRALSQRGKGGVYHALDTSVDPIRFCVLKEGRRHGETDWDGRDGYWRLKHEKRVLLDLRHQGIKVPTVYCSFRSGRNLYVAMESIEGVTLATMLRKKRLSRFAALTFGIKLARLLQRIHAAGWVWRDCKPLNLVVTKGGALRPIDFEGACRVNGRESAPWGTPGYVPKESNSATTSSRLPEDLYALGATLYHLFTGRISNPDDPLRDLENSRRIPPNVRDLIRRLTADDPKHRPSAQEAVSSLRHARRGLRHAK